MNTQYLHKWLDCSHYTNLIKNFEHPQNQILKKIGNKEILGLAVKRTLTQDGVKSVLRLDTIDSGMLKAKYLPLDLFKK